MCKIISRADKKNGGIRHLIPMQDESHANTFAYNDWVYVNDGRAHGKIPAIVLPGVMHIFGGEKAIRAAGYRKHWIVFENTKTGECTFGNKPSFLNSTDADDRERAEYMPFADIELLKTL